ncbi:hypothetical protein [Congregicoccus parvus]|uniref:hypothetical protein n=1 Tax=Congregicoccus parvus TaxID=3081749 RepID=UPI003FA59136
MATTAGRAKEAGMYGHGVWFAVGGGFIALLLLYASLRLRRRHRMLRDFDQVRFLEVMRGAGARRHVGTASTESSNPTS